MSKQNNFLPGEETTGEAEQEQPATEQLDLLGLRPGEDGGEDGGEAESGQPGQQWRSLQRSEQPRIFQWWLGLLPGSETPRHAAWRRGALAGWVIFANQGNS